jgi:hypothetical protein
LDRQDGLRTLWEAQPQAVPWGPLFVLVIELLFVREEIRFMPVAEFLKNGWVSAVVTGGVVGYIGARVEPFKSHILLAALAAVGMGVLAGIIEVGARKIAGRMRDR